MNTVLEKGIYPQMWKRETITPIPKIHPAPPVSKLRPLSGVYNLLKLLTKLWHT